MSPKILTVIPVYNHASTLPGVVRRVMELSGETLVVDDGSKDDVAHLLSGLKVKVIRHPKNLGKGAAILTAVGEARRMGMTHIVTLDADGQHDPADLKRFIPLIREDPEAIVIGKRDFSDPSVPGSSRFGRTFSNFWFRLQTGCSAGDSQSGFRAYPVHVIDHLDLREKGYSFEIEVLVKAAWAGVKVRCVDISVYYPPRKERISHFRLGMDNLRLSLLNTRLTMRGILPFPHRQVRQGEEPVEKVSLRSPLKAVRYLLSENGSPGKLAVSGALGVFLGAVPLVGFHTVSILMLASFLRLNRVAAISASQLCMPPFVPALCIETGYLLRNGRFLTDISLQTLGYEGLERIYEWVIGSFVLGPIMAVVVGGAIYGMALFVNREKIRRGADDDRLSDA